MESYNKDLRIDVDAVIASKSERLAKFTPKFVLRWLKKIIHQDEMNSILQYSNGALDVEFADKVLLWLNAKAEVKFTDRGRLDPGKKYIFLFYKSKNRFRRNKTERT